MTLNEAIATNKKFKRAGQKEYILPLNREQKHFQPKFTIDDIEAIEAIDWEVEQKEIAITGSDFRLLFDEAQREVSQNKLIYSLTDVREKLCEKMGL